MQITHYLITNGDLNNKTDALIVEVDSISYTVTEAVEQFILDTGTDRDQVVVQPVLAPLNPNEYPS